MVTEEGVASTLVCKEGISDLQKLGWCVKDAPQALDSTRVPHDAPYLYARLEVTRLLRILLLRRFGPDHWQVITGPLRQYTFTHAMSAPSSLLVPVRLPSILSTPD